MTYFLDFDRTLFDTDAFLASLSDDAQQEFAPGELSKFLYPDVPEFFRMHEGNCIVITFGTVEQQRAKIESAMARLPRVQNRYIDTQNTSPFITQMAAAYTSGSIAAADTAEELEAIAKAAPQVKLFEMRRDGGAGDGRWPVVHSLTDIPSIF